jgi:hypothetical protein
MGIIPGPEQLTKKAVMAGVAVPEGIIMLTIAIFLDIAGLICFILDFAGVGIVLSFLPDIMGTVGIGFWVTTRSFFKGVVAKGVSDMAEKTLNVGGGLEGAKQFQGQGSSVPVRAGKKIAKTGIKLGLSAIRFIVALIIELIPFLGDIMPSWTLLVLSELVSGEM